MSGGNAVGTYIAKAEAHVAAARERWSASSVARCEECIQELLQAASAMEAAQAAVAAGATATGAKRRLAQLRSDLDQLSRRVDASLAFCRGLALHSGEEEAAPAAVEG